MSPGSTLPAFLTCFVMRDILCNGLKFELILKFSMKNTSNWHDYWSRSGKLTRIGELSLAQPLQGR